MLIRKRINGKYVKEEFDTKNLGDLLYGKAKELWDSATDEQRSAVDGLMNEVYVGYEIPTVGAINSFVITSWDMFNEENNPPYISVIQHKIIDIDKIENELWGYAKDRWVNATYNQRKELCRRIEDKFKGEAELYKICKFLESGECNEVFYSGEF